MRYLIRYLFRFRRFVRDKVDYAIALPVNLYCTGLPTPLTPHHLGMITILSRGVI